MARLRPAEPDDMAPITALHIASWQTTYRGIISDTYLSHDIYTDLEHLWQQRFLHPRPGKHIWLAENKGRLCGFICFEMDNHPKWGTLIENLHINQYSQGLGLGKQLLSAAAELTYNQFPDKGMYLEVLEKNLAAQRFYQRLGAAKTREQTWQAPDGSQVNEHVLRWRTIIPLITKEKF